MALCTKWRTLVPKLWKGWCTNRSPVRITSKMSWLCSHHAAPSSRQGKKKKAKLCTHHPASANNSVKRAASCYTSQDNVATKHVPCAWTLLPAHSAKGQAEACSKRGRKKMRKPKAVSAGRVHGSVHAGHTPARRGWIAGTQGQNWRGDSGVSFTGMESISAQQEHGVDKSRTRLDGKGQVTARAAQGLPWVHTSQQNGAVMQGP